MKNKKTILLMSFLFAFLAGIISIADLNAEKPASIIKHLTINPQIGYSAEAEAVRGQKNVSLGRFLFENTSADRDLVIRGITIYSDSPHAMDLLGTITAYDMTLNRQVVLGSVSGILRFENTAIARGVIVFKNSWIILPKQKNPRILELQADLKLGYHVFQEQTYIRLGVIAHHVEDNSLVLYAPPVIIHPSGAFAVNLDVSSPAVRTVAAGTKNVLMTVLRVGCSREPVAIRALALERDGSLPLDIDLEYSVWDGNDKAGEGMFPRGYATSLVYLNNVICSKDGWKVLVIHADIPPWENLKESVTAERPTLAIDHSEKEGKTFGVGVVSGVHLAKKAPFRTYASRIIIESPH